MSYTAVARLTLVLCLAAAALPVQASAAGWQPVGQLSTGAVGQAEDVQVAFDGDGDGVAVWRRHGADYRSYLEAATRPAGGSWSAPQVITVSELNRHVFYPRITMDAAGNALITYIRDVAQYGPQVIQAIEKPAGQPFGAPQTLPNTGGVSIGTSGTPSVVMDAAGNATAIFNHDATGTPRSVIRVMSRPSGGPWSAPTDLTANTVHSYYPDAAIDADGDITVAWREGYSSQAQQVLSKTKPAGGAWQSTADVLSTVAHTNGAEPDVVVAPNGKAVVAWQQYGTPGWHTYTAVRDAGAGTWDTQDVTSSGEQALDPRLGVDGTGRVTLAWTAAVPAAFPNPAYNEVRVADLAAGATTFGAKQAVSSRSSSITGPRLDVREDGGSTVVWRDAVAGSGEPVLQASERNGAGWTTPATAADTGGNGGHFTNHTVSHDPSGNVLLGYGLSTRLTTYTAQLSVFDRTPPTLSDVVVPATATAGVPIQMTAVATDDWSTADPEWGFGPDTVLGSPVMRAFAAGAHTVSTRAVDAVGNASDPVEHTVTATTPGGGGGNTSGSTQTEPTAPLPVLPPSERAQDTPAAGPSENEALVSFLTQVRAQVNEMVQWFEQDEITEELVSNGTVSAPFSAPSAGTAIVRVEQTSMPRASGVRAAAKPKARVFARGSRTFRAAGAGRVTIRTTRAGRRTLRRSARKVHARLVVKFQGAGGRTTVRKRRVTLGR